MRLVTNGLLLTIAMAASVSFAWAQENQPLSEAVEAPPLVVAPVEVRIDSVPSGLVEEAAVAALRQGFPSLAVPSLSRLFDSASGEDRLRLGLELATAQLALGQPARAREVLQALPADDAGVHLRLALAALLGGDINEAQRWVAGLEAAPLAGEEAVWRDFALAHLQEAAGEFETSRQTLARASAQASNQDLRRLLDVLVLRTRLALGDREQETLAELAEAEESLRGQRAGFEAGRLLALAQARMGDTTAAVATLERLLTTPGLEEANQQGPLLLTLAVVAGPDSGRARLALRQVIEGPYPPGIQEQALLLLAQRSSTGKPEADLRQALAQWVEAQPPHPLRDTMLYLQALWSLRSEDYDAAERAAQRLIADSSDAFLTNSGRWFLAYLNWSRPAPRYRTAADYLQQLRADAKGERASELAGLMADAYFLNKDFGSAADHYAAALTDAPPNARPRLIFQLVNAQLGAGRPQAAAEALDQNAAGLASLGTARWEAEWNLIDFWRRNGASETAWNRLRALLNDPSGLEPALALRLRWLELRLSLDNRRFAQVPELADNLVTRAQESPLEDDLRRAVVAEALLLKGEALDYLGQDKAAQEVFGVLRTDYPQSGPAILSFLVEARRAGAGGSLAASQQTLVELADRFSGSRYAPLALWEAALMAERQRLPRNLSEAIALLSRLIERNPDHPMAFYARLKQADLSRELNDFATAEEVYRRMRQTYADHPERYRVELGLADTYLARGSTQPQSRLDAEYLYQQIWLREDAPAEVRAEAAYKWGLAVQQQGRTAEAREAWWMSWQQMSARLRERELSARGAYWLNRLGLDLAANLEAAGQKSEAQRLRTVVEARLRQTADPVGAVTDQVKDQPDA